MQVQFENARQRKLAMEYKSKYSNDDYESKILSSDSVIVISFADYDGFKIFLDCERGMIIIISVGVNDRHGIYEYHSIIDEKGLNDILNYGLKEWAAMCVMSEIGENADVGWNQDIVEDLWERLPEIRFPKGEVDEANEEYQDFMKIWADVEGDFPWPTEQHEWLEFVDGMDPEVKDIIFGNLEPDEIGVDIPESYIAHWVAFNIAVRKVMGDPGFKRQLNA